MVYTRQIAFFALIYALKHFQVVLTSDFIERSESFKVESFNGNDIPHNIPSYSHFSLRSKNPSIRSKMGIQAALNEDSDIFDIEISVNDSDIDGDDSDSSWQSSSVVSESFLEDIGLRSSHSSSSSLHSPSHMPQISPSSRSYFFENDDANDKAVVGDNVEAKDFDDITLNETNISDSINVDQTPTVEIVEVRNSVNTATVVRPPSAHILNLPESILGEIMEYCIDDTLLEARLVNNMFKCVCDKILNFMSVLTFCSDSVSFFDKYSLASTMMPFYRRQIQVRDIVTSVLKMDGKPWYMLSLFEAGILPSFKDHFIFSDKFIREILIPRLKLLPRNSPNQPSSLFLLGEALLKSKRFNLFEASLLPTLNSISVQMFSELAAPPNANLISPGFLTFAAGNQIVLGATLHIAINHNLTLTVYHLIRLHPSVIQLKNHLGRTALLQIIYNLWRWSSPIPGPEINENLNEWMDEITRKFLQGQFIQSEFSMNSRLLIEMFLGIVGCISSTFATAEEAVDFMEFNVDFVVYNQIGNRFYKHNARLLQELVSAQQYDLIISIGVFYGPLIINQVGNTPLHVAAEKNDPVITGLLLKFYSGINVNQLTSSGCSAVGLAVSRKSFEALRVLLNDPRTDPNEHSSVSPLIQSIEFCPIEIVNLLLSHPNIDLHHRILVNNRKFVSPVERAVNDRNWRVLELLLKHPNQNYEQDSSALAFLKKAEKALIRDTNYTDLLELIKDRILPTIFE